MTAPRLLTIVHTIDGLEPVFDDAAATGDSSARITHVVDAELFDFTTGEPGLDFDRTVTRLRQHVQAAERQGADAVIVSCSTSGPATEVVAAISDIPVIRVNRPLAQQAVATSGSIAVVSTDEGNLASTRALLEEEAAAAGSQVSIAIVHVAGALEALRSGDRARHDSLVREAVASHVGAADRIVLAQASVAGIGLESSGAEVLTSPRAAVEAALSAGPPAPRPPLSSNPGVSQLRIYRIRDGLMRDWLPFFRNTLVPLHALVGVPVPVAWVNPADPQEFVWIRQFDSADTVQAQEAEFFGTDPRRALGDVRGRWVEDLQVRVLEPALPSPAQPPTE